MTTNNQNSGKPTAASVLADLNKLRRDVVAGNTAHQEAGQALARRIDVLETFVSGFGEMSNQGTVDRWAEEASRLRGDLDALVESIGAVDSKATDAGNRATAAQSSADLAQSGVAAIMDPKTKGSLPRVNKGLATAHKRISALEELLQDKLQDLVGSLQNGFSQKGVIAALRAAGVGDDKIKQTLVIMTDGELDLTDAQFVAEFFTAYDAYVATTNARLVEVEERQTTTIGRVANLEDWAQETNQRHEILVTRIVTLENSGIATKFNVKMGLLWGLVFGVIFGLAYNAWADVSDTVAWLVAGTAFVAGIIFGGFLHMKVAAAVNSARPAPPVAPTPPQMPARPPAPTQAVPVITPATTPVDARS